MKFFKKAMATLLAAALLIGCAISGLVLPVAAEGDTFKMGYDHIYVAPADSAGYVTYVAVPLYTMDGQPYTETVTWATSNSNKLSVSSAAKGIFATKKNTSGDVTITATNAAGESHSCVVTICFDGEMIAGGDFESLACQTGFSSDRWKNIITSGKGKVSDDLDDSSNHVLELPAGVGSGEGVEPLYYSGLRCESGREYVVSFDIKGATGEIKPITFPGSYVTVLASNTGYYTSGNWQWITPKADEWTHYEYRIKTKTPSGKSFNRNYIVGFGNSSTTNPVYIDNFSMYELGTAESVTLNTEAQTLVKGESTQLSYTYAPDGSTVNRAKWTSSDETVATVDANGNVTAVNPGTATITLKCGWLKSTCEITVTDIMVTGIELNKSVLELAAGDSETLELAVLPTGAALAGEVTWTTNNAAVATVDGGKVTAVGKGVAIITAEADGFTTACAVTVSQSTANDTFKFAKDELRLAPADSGYVIYAGMPVRAIDGSAYTGTLTWSVDDASIISVNATSGLITTKKDVTGVAFVTAANDAGERHTFKVTVEWDGDRIAGGDFETAATNTNRWTNKIITGGAGQLVTEEDGNTCLMIPAGKTDLYYANLTVKVNTTYRLSFDIKGDTGEIKPVYFKNTTSNGWKYATPIAGGTEWKRVSYVFTIDSDITDQRSWIIGFGNSPLSGVTQTNPIYIDNVSMVEVGNAEGIQVGAEEIQMEVGDNMTVPVTATPDGSRFNYPTWESSNPGVAMVDGEGNIIALSPGTATITVTSKSATTLTDSFTVKVFNELLVVTPDMELENGELSSDAVFGELEPGDVVTVTVTPDEGYLLVPGSLKYVKKDGTAVRILNESWTAEPVFGRDSVGNTFEFEMPEEKVTITAEFVSTENQSFAMDTVGTSFHYVYSNGERVYDGIRFLTRMNLAVAFDDTSDTMTVRYNGKDYEVVELGSLLKRDGNDTELTYANAIANTGTSGMGKMWVSKAYSNTNGVFKLVDYTDSYIDFASVMMTTHYDRFYTARGYIRLKDADGEVITVECGEVTNGIGSVVSQLPAVETLDGIAAEKSASVPASHAVAPGQKVTYTFTLKNNGATSGNVTVFDPIPENTTYVEGADIVATKAVQTADGSLALQKTAAWTVWLEAGETKDISYTVRVDDDMELCTGGKVEPTVSQVGDTTVTTDYPIYIERIVNSVDEHFFNTAVKALGDSSYSDMTHIYWLYYITYSSASTGYRTGDVYNGCTAEQVLNSIINGTGTTSYNYTDSTGKAQSGTINHLDNIAPTLYGGTQIRGQIEGVKGAPAASVTEENLMIGDVIIVKVDGVVSLYVYCDKGLMKIKATGGSEKADMDLLDTLTSSQAYIVLRPRTSLTGVFSSDPEAEPVEYTPEQEAVIRTAEAFLLRGEKVQYADTDYNYGGPDPYNGSYTEYRWKIREDSPEDATIDNIKYTNCAAFTFDSYYFALGLDTGLFTTNQLASASSTYKVFDFKRTVSSGVITSTHTEEEKAQIQQQFLDTLQPGDLMVVRRVAGTGHVMMYMGNGKMIHCSGSVYRYGTNGKDPVEMHEPAIYYGQIMNYFFNPTGSNYIFGSNVHHTVIVRPLNNFKKTIPENTTNRLNNLTGIVAQKLVPVSLGKTVNVGTELTFTFDLRNTNDVAKTLTITDTVPAGTTYVSATGNAVKDGDTLTWTVPLAADEQKTVSYTVRVNNDVAGGTKIATVAVINDVVFDCPPVSVGNTLTDDEQSALITAFNALKAEGTTLANLELVNEIYKRAGIQDTVFAETALADVALGENGIFQNIGTDSAPYYALQEGVEDNLYYNMMAPTLYGGERLHTDRWTHDRTRMMYVEDLVVGDILIFRNGYYNVGYRMYLYTGEDNFYCLTTGAYDTITVAKRLEQSLGRPNYNYSTHYFMVLRPSLVQE